MNRLSSHWRWPLAALVVVLLATIMTVWRYRLPPVMDENAEGFSAARAMVTLQRLLPDGRPHPRGSPELEAVQQRLVEILEEIGVRPEVRRAEACSPFGPCGVVQNIQVHFPGETDEVVLFSAHTDSVATGPGAGDDGHGVAILVELARHLQKLDHRNGVTLLFTDGEEQGLMGAVAFVEGNPLAARVGAAVNIEARGQSGLSTLFRTAGEDAWLIDAYAEHAPRPFTSSVHQVVFETMPHYTDLSVWESFGMAGVDFAFIDRPEAYHTELDRVDLLEPRSVQSQGENALAMLEGLMDADLAHPPRGHAGWFDVMGLFVVRWPRPWTLWFCLGWTGVVVGRCWTQRKAGAVRLRGLGAGLLVVLVALLTSALVAWGLSQAPFTLHRWPAAGLVLVVSLMAMMSIGGLFAQVSVSGLHLATCLFAALTGLGVSLLWPGVAHLLVVPSLFAGMGWLAERRCRLRAATWEIGRAHV